MKGSILIHIAACVMSMILEIKYAFDVLDVHYLDFPFGDGSYLISATIVFIAFLFTLMYLTRYIASLFTMTRKRELIHFTNHISSLFTMKLNKDNLEE